MKNPRIEVLTAAADRKDDGESWNDILPDLGLNYSQAWLFWARRTIEGTDLVIDGTQEDVYLQRAIVAARNVGGEHASWGWLAVRCNLPESRVRKHFETGSNVRSDGLRIGKGGRFVQDEGRYYVEDNRKTGVVTPVGEAHAVPTGTEQDIREKLASANLKSLRAMAKTMEIKGYGSMSKGDIIAALVQAGAKVA